MRTILIFTLLAFTGGLAHGAETKRPNILFICGSDTGSRAAA